jgi:CDP-diacylglycerol---glycerol-3-phosphate 3-phosphatidyltransferase
MNIPNLLTLSRIFLVPLLVAVLVQTPQSYSFHLLGWQGDISNSMLALWCFLIAAATDMLDGYLARRWSQITTLGMLLDPIADKLLISAALIALVQVQAVPAWMVILIIGRDFAISGLRSIASAEGYVIPASDLGKSKMVLQVLAVSLTMLGLRWAEWALIARVCMWVAMLFTVLSAVDYALHFWRKIDVSVKRRRRQELFALERQRQKARNEARDR